MAVKDYLQLTRAHTAPLEIVPAVVAVILANGSGVTKIELAGWGLAGLLYHLGGYAQNSLADYERGYDKGDPNKQHHPLNRGAISVGIAKRLVNSLLTLALTWVIFMVLIQSPGRTRAILSLWYMIGAAGLGAAYNRWGKEMSSKVFPITIAHCSMFFIPYMAEGGNSLIVGLGGYIFVAIWVFFQISISGEMKDITQMREANILRGMGWVKPMPPSHKVLQVKGRALFFACMIKLVQFSVLWVIMSEVGASVKLKLGAAILALASMAASFELLKPGNYNRSSRMKAISNIEMCSVLGMALAVIPISTGLFYIITFGAIAWVFLFNSYLWGTILSPKV